MAIHIGPSGVEKEKIIVIRKNIKKELDHEIIERKGIGHPDTICDALASRLSQKYSEYTIESCDGKILHHQFDKVMLIGGKTDVTWGSGHFIKPIQVNIVGRITKSYLGKKLPITKIVNQVVEEFFLQMFPQVDIGKDLIINDFLTDFAGPGTIKESIGSIKNMFNPVEKNVIRGYEKVVANDTSCCVAYAPFSFLEMAVLEAEKYLNDDKTKRKYPWLGTDIKIMAVRHSNELDVTMCIPQIAKYVKDPANYKKNLSIISERVMDILSKHLPKDKISLAVNTKDDYQKNNFYLTVSGASLSGDIGVVGRGNRPNGLITFNRPMSLEGASGKNPLYYSGFIYSVLSRRIADRIYAILKKPCEVKIVSQNGGYLVKPWRTIVTVNSSDNKLIEKIVREEFKKIPEITDLFVRGDVTTF